MILDEDSRTPRCRILAIGGLPTDLATPEILRRLATPVPYTVTEERPRGIAKDFTRLDGANPAQRKAAPVRPEKPAVPRKLGVSPEAAEIRRLQAQGQQAGSVRHCVAAITASACIVICCLHAETPRHEGPAKHDRGSEAPTRNLA